MAAVQSTQYCRTCRTVRLVVADVRTVTQPYAAQAPRARLVYVCRTCGSVVSAQPLAA